MILQKTLMAIASFTTIAIATGSNAIAASFGGVEFPDGAISFADAVVSYNPVISHGSPISEARERSRALGTPECGFPALFCNTTLGRGGSLTLQFTDNFLTGSGDSAADLWIFEDGMDVEDTFVEISKDGQEWHGVGKAVGGTTGIDIDAFNWRRRDLFSYVRLTDDPNQGNETSWLGNFDQFLGADIDAVGAISRALSDEPPSKPSSVPEPSFVIGLLGLGVLGTCRRSHRKQKLTHYPSKQI